MKIAATEIKNLESGEIYEIGITLLNLTEATLYGGVYTAVNPELEESRWEELKEKGINPLALEDYPTFDEVYDVIKQKVIPEVDFFVVYDLDSFWKSFKFNLERKKLLEERKNLKALGFLNALEIVEFKPLIEFLSFKELERYIVPTYSDVMGNANYKPEEIRKHFTHDNAPFLSCVLSYLIYRQVLSEFKSEDFRFLRAVDTLIRD